MANIQSVLKEEIARLARREVRSETEKLKKASAQYRTQIAALKREITNLRQQVTQITKANGHAKSIASQGEIDASNMRWSPAKLKRHRERLDLSAERFAKLFDVSAQTIYNWEAGTRPGKAQLVMISQLRKLTKRKAHVIVDAST